MNKELQEQLNNDFKTAITKLEGHAEKANSEMGDMVKVVTVIQTDMSWMMKFFWIITSASVGSFIAAIANLVLRS